MSDWAASYEPYPILGTPARLREAVDDLRAWAEAHPQAASGNVYLYPHWPALTAVICRYLDSSDPSAGDEPAAALLDALARDEAAGALRSELAARPAWLLALGAAGVGSDEPDARRQLVRALDEASLDEAGTAEASRLLRLYAGDADAYVRRLALLALAERGVPEVEALARRAWMTGDAWERIGALHALEALGSPHLPALLAVAARDGGADLAAHARTIAARRGDVGAPGMA